METPDQLLATHGEPLTGEESRILRASLHLNRDQMAKLTEALGVWPKATHARVYSRERSPAGYALPVTDALHMIESAVQRWSEGLAQQAPILRPMAPAVIQARLDLVSEGLTLDAEQSAALAEAGVWSALCDAAIVRAVLAQKEAGRESVRVVAE